MKRLIICGMFLLTLILPAAALAAEEPIRLNMTGQYMEKHPVVQRVWLPWFEEVKEKSGGRLLISYFNPNTLCPEGEHLEATKKGQVAIGHNPIGRNQGRLPVSVVFDMPNVLTNSISGSEAMWRLYTEVPEIAREFEGIKILGMHSSAPIQINMAKGEISKLADLRGKKILVNNGDKARIVRSLGANAIVTPVPDFYLSLSRNMADGCFVAIAPLRSYKINEALKSITVCNFGLSGFWLGMNQNTYNSLPPDLRKVIDETTGLKISLAAGRALLDGDAEDSAKMKTEGIKFSIISAAERTVWLEKAAPVAKSGWFEQMGQRDLANAQAIYDKAQKIFTECEAKHLIK